MTREASHPPAGYEERLRAALRREADRYQLRVTPGAVRAAMTGPERMAISHWWAVAAVPLLVVALTAAILLFVPETAPALLIPSATPQTSVAPTIAGPISADTPITLAQCAIAPQDALLAFAGWTTPDLLGITFPDPARGQPVYALVTAAAAAWAGPDTSGTQPMFQGRSSRLACIYSPTTHYVSVVGVHNDWRPPEFADGCPVSPINDFAGYREAGGPDAWLTLPSQAGSWEIVGNLSYLLSFRLSPPARPGQAVTAWAQPLASGDRTAAEVVASPAPTVTTPPANSRFYRVTVSFSRPGCWVVNLAVDGRVAGSAVVPIGAIGAIAEQPEATQPAVP